MHEPRLRAHSSSARRYAAVTRNFNSDIAVSHKVMRLCFCGYYWNTFENICVICTVCWIVWRPCGGLRHCAGVSVTQTRSHVMRLDTPGAGCRLN
jgi:hypothetical protein